MNEAIKLMRRLLDGNGAAPHAMVDTAVQAAARADDVEFLTELARRSRLPEASRQILAGRREAPVRAAYLTRSDADPAQIRQLLEGETRTAVLAPVAAHVDADADSPIKAALEATLVARPTKTLAKAMGYLTLEPATTEVLLHQLLPVYRTLPHRMQLSLRKHVERLASNPADATRIDGLLEHLAASTALLGAAVSSHLPVHTQHAIIDAVAASGDLWATRSVLQAMTANTTDASVLQHMLDLVLAKAAEPDQVTNVTRERMMLLATKIDAARQSCAGVRSSGPAPDDPLSMPVQDMTPHLRMRLAKEGTDGAQLTALTAWVTTAEHIDARQITEALMRNTHLPLQPLLELVNASKGRLDAVAGGRHGWPIQMVVARVRNADNPDLGIVAQLVQTCLQAWPIQAVEGGMLRMHPDPCSLLEEFLTTWYDKEHPYGTRLKFTAAVCQSATPLGHPPEPYVLLLRVTDLNDLFTSDKSAWRRAMTPILSEHLGQDLARWEAYSAFAAAFPGTLGELLRTIDIVSPAAE